MTTIVIQYYYRLCQIECVCRSSHLVEDDLELGLGGGEVQHYLAEVLAEFGAEPGSADYHIIAACGLNFLFSVEFCESIDSGGSASLVFAARCVVGSLTEYVIGGDVHQQASDFLHRYGKILRGCGVEILHKVVFCQIFRSIYIGPGSTVDDGLYVVLLDVLPYGFYIGDVEMLLAFAYIGEEVCVATAFRADLHLVAELAVCACYKYIHTSVRERCFEVLEQRVTGVLVTQEGFVGGNAPVYAEAAVQYADASVGLWGVEVVAFVLEDRCLAEDGKAVGEAFGHEELAVVLFGEFDCHVLAVGRAAFADIHCHIEHPAPDAPDEFALGVGRPLEVEPAHHSVGGHRFIVLHEVYLQPGLLLELACVEALEEVSAGVPEDFGLDDEQTLYVCFYYFHLWDVNC